MNATPAGERAKSVESKLRAALVVLAVRRRIDQVTASELIRSAGVGRSTFYRRFNNVSDFLEAVQRSFLDELTRAFRSAQWNARDDGRYSVLASRVNAVLNITRQNADIVRTLCSGAEGELFRRRCSLHAEGLIAEDLSILALTIDSSYCPADYVLAFLAGGVVSVVSKWLANPTPEPIDDVTFYIVALMSGGTSDFLI